MEVQNWKSENGKISLFKSCNLPLMKSYPDKYFDLSVVDPPYGIDAGNIFYSAEKMQSGKGVAKKSKFRQGDWDKSIPDQEYFDELFRISKNVIIWGANYMVEHLFNSKGWIVWDKNNGETNFADCELAYTSFDRATRIFRYTWNGMLQGNMKNKEVRFHPTQKPVQLYKWIFLNYAEPGWRIFDSHLGSGSIAIGIDHVNKVEGMNLTFVGCEKDDQTFTEAVDHVKIKTAQIIDLQPENLSNVETFQQSLFNEDESV